MKFPRDMSGDLLIHALAAVDYFPTRQRGSHVRLTTTRNGKHSVTVPRIDPLPVGTLSGILSDVAGHLGVSRDELISCLLQ